MGILSWLFPRRRDYYDPRQAQHRRLMEQQQSGPPCYVCGQEPETHYRPDEGPNPYNMDEWQARETTRMRDAFRDEVGRGFFGRAEAERLAGPTDENVIEGRWS